MLPVHGGPGWVTVADLPAGGRDCCGWLDAWGDRGVRSGVFMGADRVGKFRTACLQRAGVLPTDGAIVMLPVWGQDFGLHVGVSL